MEVRKDLRSYGGVPITWKSSLETYNQQWWISNNDNTRKNAGDKSQMGSVETKTKQEFLSCVTKKSFKKTSEQIN